MRPFAPRPHRDGARVRTTGDPAPVRRRRVPGTLAVAALAVTTLGTGPAVATEAPEVTLRLTGTVRLVMADGFGEEHAGEAPSEVLTMVEVDGALHDLTGQPAMDGTRNGTEVVLTFEAEAGSTGEEALDAVAQAEPGSAVAPAGTATLVDVAPVDPFAEAPTTSDGRDLLAAAVGARTITVLPVHGGTLPAGQPATSQLTTWAEKAGLFWTDQSDGRLTFTATARDWKRIAMSPSCDPDAIFERALAAHGMSGFSDTGHVVVYFPKLTTCGWSGLGTVGGGAVWVNGDALEDVLTHELGHNLGLGHANTLTCTVGGKRVTFDLAGHCEEEEYADTADVMGFAQIMPSGNLTTAAADVLGFAHVHDVTTADTGVTTVDLAPLAQVGAMRAVSLPAPGIPEGRLYVDFRPALGRDLRQLHWAGVQAHLSAPDDRGIPHTYLLDLRPTTPGAFTSPALAVGTTWVLPGLGLDVQVESVGTSARVAVTSDPAARDTVAPTAAVVTAPAPGSVVTGATTVRWNAATDAVGVTGYEIRVDGEVRGRAPGMARSVRLDELTPGPHAVSVDPVDGAGNRAAGAPVSFTVTADAVQQFVARVYADLFGRSPDAHGLLTWANALKAGTPRVAVANAITGSDEYRSRLIQASYRQYLGRGADPHGLASWLRAMRSGMTIQEMEVGFVASPEYYGQSGSDDARWVTRLYQHVLGRTPAATEVRHWQGQIAKGLSRAQVARGFLLSTEHLTTVVDGHYRHLLGRGIDPTGARSWVTAIQRGARVESIVGGIIASAEYARR
jgi:hypothetical protein